MKKIFLSFGLALIVLIIQFCAISAQPPGGERPVFPVQAALDVNQDGIISADEIAKSPAALRKLDKNGDGKLTEDELRPNFDRRGPGGPPENNSANIVGTLMEFDKNKDGKLSKDEVPERMQGIFARGDANKDGVLTKDELEKMAASQAGASNNEERGERGERGEGGRRGPGGMMRMMPLMAALDTDGDGVISADEIAKAPTSLLTLDKNNDGKLTEDEIRPQGRGRGFGGNPDEFAQRLMEFDKNGDGKLSKDELPDRMQELMERADTNHDGFLTPDELKNFASQMGGGRGRQEGERPRQRPE